MPLTLKNFNKTTPPYKTFTISRTEQSNMSSGWTYSDDATGLTAGSTAFDEFFGYSGVRLNGSGVETAEITQSDSGGYGKLDITQLGTITSGDNVMIKFPRRGIKMSKSGSVVTLSITSYPNKDGYQYYAHCTGTLSNPGTPKDAFYLGAYKGYYSNGALKSLSGQSPTVNQTIPAYCSYAKGNGTGYNIIGFYQRMYITALYMMKYGNPNSQSVVGNGFTSGYPYQNTGGTDSQTNATYGTTSNYTTQMKLFGLEDRWGNITEMVGGAYTDGSKYLYVQLSGYSGYLSYGELAGSIKTTTGNELSSIVGNNKLLFGPYTTVNNSSYNTYYCDYAYVYGSRIIMTGGDRNSGDDAGVLRFTADGDASSHDNNTGSRIMYL